MNPSLKTQVAQLLSTGPVHTLDVAREALRLRGPESAAAAAVFTLLDGDPRFQVDQEGNWSLDHARPSPGRPLPRVPYAVVDVETTGGGWRRGDRVTEVAVVPVTEGQVGDGLESLVNPGRSIPPRIQGLTGITDEMVRGAPTFTGLAPRVEAALEGRVFVAHNVRFDWGFIRSELLASTGDAPEPSLLCTLRMGRFLLPRLRRYGLDALTRHFGIPIHSRHRAYGDALATARLLLHLLREAESQGFGDLHSLEEAMSGRGPKRKS